MGKIRDFIYNCSDIFAALIILGLAAYLIFTRIDIIMAYPDSYTPSQTELNQPLDQNDGLNGGDGENGGVPSPAGIDNGSATGGAVDQGANSAGAADPAAAATGGAVTPPDATTTITVDIPAGATAEQVGNILYEKGLVANTEDFTYAYTSMQKAGLKTGSITINSNCTMEELVNAVSQ